MSDHPDEESARAAIREARAELIQQGFLPADIDAGRWEISTVQPDP